MFMLELGKAGVCCRMARFYLLLLARGACLVGPEHGRARASPPNFFFFFHVEFARFVMHHDQRHASLPVLVFLLFAAAYLEGSARSPCAFFFHCCLHG